MPSKLWYFVLALAAAATSRSLPAAPPPPPPDFIDQIAKQLVSTPSSETFDRYAALFGDDVKVSLNGNRIAVGKPAWLAIVRNRLGKVDRIVYGYAEDRDSVLIMDRFDDRSDEHCPPGGTCVFDPRWHARAVRYEIGADHLIHAIQIVESNGNLRTP